MPSIFYILISLFWPVVIIWGIVHLVRRRTRKGRGGKHPSLMISKEDGVSETLLLLSLFFLGVTLLSINRDIGSLLSWQTIIFITSAIGIALAYRLKIVYTLAFSLIGFFAWWSGKAAEWTMAQEISASGATAGIALGGLLLYTLGRFHEKILKKIRFSQVYLIFGILIVTALLFLLSTRLGLGLLENITSGVSIFGSWQLVLSLAFLVVAVLGISFFTTSQRAMSPKELVAVLVLAVLFITIAFLPEQNLLVQGGFDRGTGYTSGSYTSAGILWAIIFNLLIFFEVLGLVFLGYVRREKWLINIGALFLFFLIAVKYFDWFFTFLDKSIFFIGAGILLFIVGWFMERGRRNVLQNIESKGEIGQISQP